MNPNEPAAPDQQRVGEPLLARFDGNQPAVDQTDTAIEDAPGSWRRAFDTLAALYVNLMVAGEQKTRQVLQMSTLDASMHVGKEEQP